MKLEGGKNMNIFDNFSEPYIVADKNVDPVRYEVVFNEQVISSVYDREQAEKNKKFYALWLKGKEIH